jgi:hypothetical protein
MGSSYSRNVWEPRSDAAERGWVTRRENAKRMALADKIVMAVVDRIAADIIRPGPKPEERECYVMAQELRDHTAHLKELVSAILAVEASEGEL